MNRRAFLASSLGLAASVAAKPRKTARADTTPRRGATAAFDVAIIGAGLFGSAAARHLSAHTDGVALIGPAEPADPSAPGGVYASHYDASRLTRIVDPSLVWGTLARRSVARYRAIERLSGIAFYHEVGYMMVTPGGLGTDWFNFPAMREVAADLNVSVEELDDKALQQRFSYLRFTPGSGGFVQPRNAGYFNPRRLVAAQQQLAAEQGTTLIRDVVTAIKTSGDQVELATKAGETVRANRILIATGASTNIAGLLPHRLDTAVRAAMIMLAEVAPEPDLRYPSILYAKTDGAEPFWGLLMPPIRYPDGRYYVKTMDGYYGPSPLVSTGDMEAWSRSRGHEDHHAVLQRALREVFPSLAVSSTRFKPCFITDTASHFPYIDMVDDRVGVVVGGNGKSAKSSDEIGRLAAAMIRTQGWPSSLPQALFKARFV